MIIPYIIIVHCQNWKIDIDILLLTQIQTWVRYHYFLHVLFWGIMGKWYLKFCHMYRFIIISITVSIQNSSIFTKKFPQNINVCLFTELWYRIISQHALQREWWIVSLTLASCLCGWFWEPVLLITFKIY